MSPDSTRDARSFSEDIERAQRVRFNDADVAIYPVDAPGNDRLTLFNERIFAGADVDRIEQSHSFECFGEESIPSTCPDSGKRPATGAEPKDL